MAKMSAKNIGAWVLSVLLAFSFLASGFPKLSPAESMVTRFENWGYSGGFATLIGILEMSGSLLVLIPGLATFGAAIICTVMIGATYTHLSTGIGSPMTAMIFLVLAGILGWLRFKDAYLLSSGRSPDKAEA